MAHLRELTRKCQQCDIRTAVVELIGNRNETFGFFCRSCGERKAKYLQQQEDRHDRRNPEARTGT